VDFCILINEWKYVFSLIYFSLNVFSGTFFVGHPVLCLYGIEKSLMCIVALYFDWFFISALCSFKNVDMLLPQLPKYVCILLVMLSCGHYTNVLSWFFLYWNHKVVLKLPLNTNHPPSIHPTTKYVLNFCLKSVLDELICLNNAILLLMIQLVIFFFFQS